MDQPLNQWIVFMPNPSHCLAPTESKERDDNKLSPESPISFASNITYTPGGSHIIKDLPKRPLDTGSGGTGLLISWVKSFKIWLQNEEEGSLLLVEDPN